MLGELAIVDGDMLALFVIWILVPLSLYIFYPYLFSVISVQSSGLSLALYFTFFIMLFIGSLLHCHIPIRLGMVRGSVSNNVLSSLIDWILAWPTLHWGQSRSLEWAKRVRACSFGSTLLILQCELFQRYICLRRCTTSISTFRACTLICRYRWAHIKEPSCRQILCSAVYCGLKNHFLFSKDIIYLL